MKHIKRIDEGFFAFGKKKGFKNDKNYNRVIDFEELYADKVNNDMINDLFDLSLEHIDNRFSLGIVAYIKIRGDYSPIFYMVMNHSTRHVEWYHIKGDELNDLAINGVKNIFNNIDSFIRKISNQKIHYEFCYVKGAEWVDQEIEKTIQEMYPKEDISADKGATRNFNVEKY